MTIGVVLILGAGYWHVRARPTQGASYWHVQAPYPLENERFGVGGSPSKISLADWQALGAGWYVPWGASLDPPHPAGALMLQTLRIDGAQPVLDDGTITALVEANPASVWRVGNEPDSPWQDSATPQQYAQVYHQLYHLVKSADPQAQVAFGGLVQATPLRLLYLDHAWQAYQNLYGEPMPVDVWTLHSFILPETGNWGAGIPPGMGAYAHLATSYELRDHDDMSIFTGRIVDFRQWMADHGQQNKPLLIPEYGILLWPIYQDEDGRYFDDERVIEFMYATFDFFLSATDPALGYPADGNRLVQTWAWYSLDDDVYYDGQKIGEGYGGDLFTGPPYSKTMTALGQAYADYVTPLVGPEYTDLWPMRLRVARSAPFCRPPLTLTLTVEVANYGRQPAQDVAVRFWDGDPDAGGTPIGELQVIDQVPGRYEGVGEASLSWTTDAVGPHDLWVQVDPTNTVAESDEGNNRASWGVLVPDRCLFVPAVTR